MTAAAWFAGVAGPVRVFADGGRVVLKIGDIETPLGRDILADLIETLRLASDRARNQRAHRGGRPS